MEHFVSGSTARCVSELVNVNKNTAAYFFHRLREIIYQATEDEAPFSGEIEVDESYFGGVRKGKRGRGAAGKVPVFGLLKRGGRVYARVIPDTKSKTLMGIIKNRIVPDSIVYSDGYHSYNVLMCQRQTIKTGGLQIIRIGAINFFHGFGISFVAQGFFTVAIKQPDSMNIILFPLR